MINKCMIQICNYLFYCLMTFLKIKLLFSGQCSLCPASNWCPRAILSGFLLESRCPALHRAAPVGTGSYWAQTAPVPKT